MRTACAILAALLIANIAACAAEEYDRGQQRIDRYNEFVTP